MRDDVIVDRSDPIQDKVFRCTCGGRGISSTKVNAPLLGLGRPDRGRAPDPSSQLEQNKLRATNIAMPACLVKKVELGCRTRVRTAPLTTSNAGTSGDTDLEWAATTIAEAQRSPARTRRYRSCNAVTGMGPRRQ